MATILTKKLLQDTIETIKEVYLEDNIPWICGYSGGKDSSAVVQLVWTALSELPKEKRTKTVHVISTDTLVESPVVSIWASQSLKKMKEAAEKAELPIIPHRLTPQIQNTFWVNLIGRGYPAPRVNFRWCTDRLKIDTSNQFIKSVLAAESEAILVLGSRKAESATRRKVMEGYEEKRYREHADQHRRAGQAGTQTSQEKQTYQNRPRDRPDLRLSSCDGHHARRGCSWCRICVFEGAVPGSARVFRSDFPGDAPFHLGPEYLPVFR